LKVIKHVGKRGLKISRDKNNPLLFHDPNPYD
jgi:hypothetical protein